MIFSLAACGSKKEKKDVVASTGEKQTVFIKGDIKALYEGTELNKTSFLTLDNYKDFDNFLRVEYRVYKNFDLAQTEKQKKAFQKMSEEERSKQLKKGQLSKKENVADNTQFTYFFVKDDKTGNIIYTDNKESIQLIFQVDRDRSLNLSKLKFKGEKEDLEISFDVLHYSVDEKKQNFSFLVKPEKFKELEALYIFKFSKDTKKKLVGLSQKPYEYFLGPTKKAVLRENSKISLCTKNDSWMNNEVEDAFAKWNLHMPKDYLKFEIKRQYPPVSDVNTKCIYIIEDYAMTDPEGNSVINGQVFATINVNTREIVDTDMMISIEEWKKNFEYRDGLGSIDNPSEKGREEFYETAVHEMGHILGLAHAFSEEDVKGKKSIMNYEEHKEFSDYDIESIKNLYRDFYDPSEL